MRRLGDILVEDGLITPTQRDEALRVQKSHGGRIGTNLVQLGAIDLEALGLALSRQKGLPAAQQRHFDSIHPEAVALLSAQLAHKHAAIPLGFTSRHPKTIGVAFLDPAKPGAVDEIQRATGAKVYAVIAPELRIVRYLEKLYGIPRHPRFLQLEGDGEQHRRRAPRAGVGDPRSFFDMSRPDLSQAKPASPILLTEKLRVPETANPAPRGGSTPPVVARGPEPGASERAPRSGPPAGRAGVAAGTPSPSAPPRPPSVAALPSSSAAAPVPPQVLRPEASGARPSPPPLRRPPEVLHRQGEGEATGGTSGEPSGPDASASGDPAAPSDASAGVSIWSPLWRATQAEGPLPLDSAPDTAPADLEAQRASASPAPTAEATPPGPPAAPRAWSAAQAVDAMAVASTRDQVAEALVNYLRTSCGVGLVLLVQHEVAMGWRGFAPGIGSEEIDALAIPLAAPSVLRTAYQEQEIYRGPPSQDTSALDLQVFERLGVALPQEVIVAPVLLRDRVVNLVFGHAADGGPLPERVSTVLGTLTRSAAAAYVRLIQEAKKRTPG